MGAGGAVQAVGSMVGGIGAAKAGMASSEADYQNAATNQYNAGLAIAQSNEEARRQGVMAYKQIGQMKANYGASGITTEGSAMDVIQNSAANAQLDADTIRAGGAQKAWAYNRGASMDLLKGGAAQEAGGIGFASGLLGAAKGFEVRKKRDLVNAYD